MALPPPSVDACTRGSLDNWALNATVAMSFTDTKSTLKLGVNGKCEWVRGTAVLHGTCCKYASTHRPKHAGCIFLS